MGDLNIPYASFFDVGTPDGDAKIAALREWLRKNQPDRLGDFDTKLAGFKALLPTPPPAAPDLSGELVQRAASVQRLHQLTQQGLGSSFLTGPMGLSMPAPTSIPGLGGS